MNSPKDHTHQFSFEKYYMSWVKDLELLEVYHIEDKVKKIHLYINVVILLQFWFFRQWKNVMKLSDH